MSNCQFHSVNIKTNLVMLMQISTGKIY